MGGLLIFVSIHAILFLKKIKLVGEPSQGDLIDFEIDHDGDRIPIIRFKTTDGSTIEGKPYVFTSAFFASFKLNRPKKHVPLSILYLPESPNRFIINKRNSFDFSVLIFFMIAGFAFSILGTLELTDTISIF